MGKRRKASVSENYHEASPSTKKQKKRRFSSLGIVDDEDIFTSTPMMQESAESGCDEEQNVEKDNCDSFASFLKQYSFFSDSEEEHQKPPEKKQRKLSNSISPRNSLTVKRSSVSILRTTLDDTDGEDLQEDSDEINILSIPSAHVEVVTLGPHSSVTIQGFVRVHALIGSAMIFGKKLKEGSSILILSTQSCGLQRVQHFKSSRKSTPSTMYRKLDSIIGDHHRNELSEFVQTVEPQTVVILVERCFLPSSLQFLQLYYPDAVQMCRYTKKKAEKKFLQEQPMCSTEKDSTLQIGKDYKLVVKEINNVIKKTGTTDEKQLRVLLHGHKNSGKSTLLRYIINRLLNRYSAVYYLDADPGQTEFTPPGVVSLVKIKQPLLGPPYEHQRKPVKMIFIGSITCTSPSMYLKSIQSLIKLFKSKFPEEILFVNTMGWIHGIGAECYKGIKSTLSPNIIIELEKSDSYQKDVADGVIRLKVPIQHGALAKKNKGPHISRPDWRNYAILSYFGQCQKPYMPSVHLNAVRPVSVCWDDVAIFIMGKKVPPNRLVEAIQCSIVALCYVHESFMLESKEAEYPTTLIDEPMNECLGFGIVRAADESDRLLYIVTPLPPDELKKVNSIIKGDIMIPDAVFLNQPIENAELPYTDHSNCPLLNRKTFLRGPRKSKSEPS